MMWDDIFVGRKEELDKLMQLTHHLVVGARRIGKTSLLRELEKFEDFPAVYESLQGAETARRIQEKFALAFTPFPAMAKIMQEQEDIFKAFIEIDSILEAPFRILLDEADVLIEINEKEEKYIEQWTNLLKQTNHLKFILAASPLFSQLLPKNLRTSNILGTFQHRHILSYLEKEDATLLVRQLAPKQKISKREISKILDYTHYHPNLIKAFLSTLIKGNKVQSPTDLLAIKAYNAFQFENVIQDNLLCLPDPIRKTIIELFIDPDAINQSTDEKQKQHLYQAEQHGFLKIVGNRFLISDWFLANWLKISLPDRISHNKQTLQAWKDLQSAKTFITQGKLIQAVDLLKEKIAPNFPRYENEIIELSRQVNTVNKESLSGLLSYDQKSRSETKISSSLLILIQDIENDL